jgi:hypothetical protein
MRTANIRDRGIASKIALGGMVPEDIVLRGIPLREMVLRGIALHGIVLDRIIRGSSAFTQDSSRKIAPL